MSQHINPTPKQTDVAALDIKIKPSLLDVTDKAYTSGSINDIPCGIYRVYANVTGTPIYGPGYCSTYERESGTKLQIFVEDSNRMFIRTKVNGTWASWQELALKIDAGMGNNLPELNGKQNGVYGFGLSAAITIDNTTIPAGTRFTGYLASSIGQFCGISPTGSLYILRCTGSTWSWLKTIDS
jgi:hypothetical protein